MNMELKDLIMDFIDFEIYDLQEEGNLCLELCEEENNYHLTSYWITGTYDNVKDFINDNYTDALYETILNMYFNDIDTLRIKLTNVYGEYSNKTLAYEALASILLKEMQKYPTWYTVYGSEEVDMIDFNKYKIHNALLDNDEFPIVKSEDIVAAMYGINDTIQASDMYDVFAHYSDELKFKDKSLVSDIEENEPTFTPDVFLVAGVVSRYKNYVDISKGKFADYAIKFFELSTYDNEYRNIAILGYAIDDYLNRFNEAPYGLPLHQNMITGKIININGEDKYILIYKIMGVKNKSTCWDTIAEITYNIPYSQDELQSFIVQIAIDFKRELNGLEKVRNKDIKAISGKYPNKLSATHGLCFAKDINVQVKDKRGNNFKRPMKANYSLALSEKQALYLIKKSLRHANINPIISSSFGIDSVTTLHLLRRVTKNFTVVFNNSLVEYPELIKYKRKLCSEWNLNDKLIETKPVETYWSLQKKNGWNFQRKGDRRNGKSNSEECCQKIKHISMYNLIDKFIEAGNPMQVNYTGLRAGESRSREQAIKRDNVVYFSKTWKSIRVNPISFFSNEMVWEYVSKYKIPYCEVYDKIVYYEDVYDKIDEDEYHKVYYMPRIGCWTCLLNTSQGYLAFMRKYYKRHYDYLMFKKGLAKDLFIPGAKKLGIITDNIFISNNENSQLSLFDNIDANIDSTSYENLTSEEIMERYSLEDMEALIMKRPCKFLV
jgi:3'-phosphoadenosine 5'-phosphosulfate sulfotransferase (PAPS reductase)/FAD synthetase